MDDLISNPICRPDQLGHPIPDDPHAVSTCLPTWADAVGYEECEPRVIEALRCGYPRFVYHPLCWQLFERCEQELAADNEIVRVMQGEGSAKRFVAFLERFESNGRIVPLGLNDAFAVVLPRTAEDLAKAYWQHTGEGVSSRVAEACLGKVALDPGVAVKQELRQRIGGLVGVDPSDVYLFPTGMTAMYTLHRALDQAYPTRRAAQFGFPYVDTLKVLEKFGPGVTFYPNGTAAELDQLTELMQREPLRAVFTELPSNPLLQSPDLIRLSALTKGADVPLIVDDTIATWLNTSLSTVADASWCSLTKYFSGVGNVAGGAVIFCCNSRCYEVLKGGMEAVYEDLLSGADAKVLEQNSRDFADRVGRINHHARQLADWLAKHPKVARVYYPSHTNAADYERHLCIGGGYGGLLSFDLHDAEQNAPRVYDALRVSKGPNLGTNYTLACPYTILAHYGELDWAESCGVSRWLIRVSVGLEPIDDLIGRFDEALGG